VMRLIMQEDVHLRTQADTDPASPGAIIGTGLREAMAEKPLRLLKMRMIALWVGGCMAYSGMAASGEFLGGSVYINTLFLAFLEIPAQPLASYVADTFGRRMGLVYLFSACAIGCGGFLIPIPLLSKICVFIGHICAAAAFSVTYIFSSELYPTQARTFWMGLTSSVGRLGACAAMMVRIYGGTNPNIPILTWGCAAIAMAFLMEHLPETHGEEPPETVEEFFFRHRSPQPMPTPPPSLPLAALPFDDKLPPAHKSAQEIKGQ
jgi:hypothetical protein